MKYAMLIGDGMADWPIPELGNKTPLEYADTPNMDSMAQGGIVGWVMTIPAGMSPGSDVANLSLMGYDPMTYYSGRAPFEAASMGITLNSTDVAFRCNLVTIFNGKMVDYSAGHIATDDAHLIINELQKEITTKDIHLFPGVSYRHLLVYTDFPEKVGTTPPHDISGKEVVSYLPTGDGASALLQLSTKASHVLQQSPVNARLNAEGKLPVTDIWLWGQGKRMSLPTMAQRFNLTGSVISAVDLIRGLGMLAGLQVCIVEGATGYLGTNYSGKIAAALESLEEQDLVYLHIEAPDETGHEGDLEKKIRAIEEFDANIVGEMLKYQRSRCDVRIIVTPDHATPLAIRTHSSEAVPFIVYGSGVNKGNCSYYGESVSIGSSVLSGTELFNKFITSHW